MEISCDEETNTKYYYYKNPVRCGYCNSFLSLRPHCIELLQTAATASDSVHILFRETYQGAFVNTLRCFILAWSGATQTVMDQAVEALRTVRSYDPPPLVYNKNSWGNPFSEIHIMLHKVSSSPTWWETE